MYIHIYTCLHTYILYICYLIYTCCIYLYIYILYIYIIYILYIYIHVIYVFDIYTHVYIHIYTHILHIRKYSFHQDSNHLEAKPLICCFCVLSCAYPAAAWQGLSHSLVFPEPRAAKTTCQER